MCTIFWIAPPQFATELFICAKKCTAKIHPIRQSSKSPDLQKPRLSKIYTA